MADCVEKLDVREARRGATLRRITSATKSSRHSDISVICRPNSSYGR
jgi:hypothetical protein